MTDKHHRTHTANGRKREPEMAFQIRFPLCGDARTNRAKRKAVNQRPFSFAAAELLGLTTQSTTTTTTTTTTIIVIIGKSSQCKEDKEEEEGGQALPSTKAVGKY